MTTTDRTRRHAVAAMTFATGVIIANNYYAQPLEAAIAEAFHASSAAVGAVLTTIQLSYALGLALLVPLGDLLERRRLVVTMLTITALGQVGVALSPALAVLASAAAVVALTSVAAQILVPFAAHLARDGEQGKTISTVMSGLLVGVLLSRVVAGVVAELLGWRAVFVLGAVLTAVALAALWRALPVLEPATRLRYPALLRSVLTLLREEPVLRWRIVYSASSYAAFGAVWTSIGFLLARPPHSLSEGVIGLFSLFGVAGALAARGAGKLADRGLAHWTVGATLLLTALSMVLIGAGTVSLVALAIGLVVFDAGVQGTHISNQTHRLRPAPRGPQPPELGVHDGLLPRRRRRQRPLGGRVRRLRLAGRERARRRVPRGGVVRLAGRHAQAFRFIQSSVNVVSAFSSLRICSPTEASIRPPSSGTRTVTSVRMRSSLPGPASRSPICPVADAGVPGTSTSAMPVYLPSSARRHVSSLRMTKSAGGSCAPPRHVLGFEAVLDAEARVACVGLVLQQRGVASAERGEPGAQAIGVDHGGEHRGGRWGGVAR